jgi:hypothetical protein
LLDRTEQKHLENALTDKAYSGINTENQYYQIFRKGFHDGRNHTGSQTWYAYFACRITGAIQNQVGGYLQIGRP